MRVAEYTNLKLAYTTKQHSRVSWLTQTGFAAFGKGIQLIGGSSNEKTVQISRLSSPSGILSTPCLVAYVNFQFGYTTTRKIGSNFLLASTSSKVLLG